MDDSIFFIFTSYSSLNSQYTIKLYSNPYFLYVKTFFSDLDG